MGREGSGDEPFAASAGHARPDDAVHDEAAGHILQFLGHILADPAQAPAALGTGVGIGCQLHLHPRDIVGDRAALRAILLDVGQPHPCGYYRRGDLAGLQSELQLFRRLGRRAKPVRPVPGQLVAELLDQDCLRLHLGQKSRREAAQFLWVFRQGQGLIKHGRSLSHTIPCGNPAIARGSDYPAANGRHVRSGARQSMPSNDHPC
jgi:hypothetical protein